MDIYRQAQFPKFAIVICEPSKTNGHADMQKWKQFLVNIPQGLQQNANIERIHENVWLIHLNTDLLPLFEIVQLYQASSMPVRVLFLEESPTWLKYPPDAKPADESKPSQTTP
jgi:hypothetical protein